MNLNAVTFYRALVTPTEWSHEIHTQFSSDCWLLLVLICIYEIERRIRGTLYSFRYIIVVPVQINCHDLDSLQFEASQSCCLKIFPNEVFHCMSKTEAQTILLSYQGDVFWDWSEQSLINGCSAAKVEIRRGLAVHSWCWDGGTKWQIFEVFFWTDKLGTWM